MFLMEYTLSPTFGHVVTYPEIDGEFMIDNADSMSISIYNIEARGKGHSYRMIKFLLETVKFQSGRRLFIDTEASGFNFWADKLQMVDTHEETGYEYGTTVGQLLRLVRMKCRRFP